MGKNGLIDDNKIFQIIKWAINVKKTRAIVILVSVIVISTIAVKLVLKFEYNKFNSKIEEVTENLTVNKVDVPDESSKV